MLDYFSFNSRMTRKLKEYFKERGFVTDKGNPPLFYIEGGKDCFDLIITYKGIATERRFLEELKHLKNFLNYRSSNYVIENGKCEIRFHNYKPLREELLDIEDNDNYKYIPLSPYQLVLGYDDNKENLIANMIDKPHLLITGLSSQGKTGMLKVIASNSSHNADIVVCNAFMEDFKGIRNVRYIKGIKDTLTYLNNIYKDIYKRERPLYIILEELATLRDATTIKIIYELLCVARHYNIYIIGVTQESLKSELKFKSLFNSIVSFAMVDGYAPALGVDYVGELAKREFVWRSEKGLIKGHTFTIE